MVVNEVSGLCTRVQSGFPHAILIAYAHIGACFYLTIVDDFTRCTWVFMQYKYGNPKILQSFITFVHTEFHASIKIIRTNNGSEFISIKISFNLVILNINIFVFTLHNKMELSNASIVIF